MRASGQIIPSFAASLLQVSCRSVPAVRSGGLLFSLHTARRLAAVDRVKDSVLSSSEPMLMDSSPVSELSSSTSTSSIIREG